MTDNTNPHDDGRVAAEVCEQVSRLLDASAAQIDMALFDGEQSVTHLTLLFREMFMLVSEMQLATAYGDSDQLDACRQKLKALERKGSKALLEFQFFDLLKQRVQHGCNSVRMLAGYLTEKEVSVCDEDWESFRSEVSGRFTLAREKRLFEMMMDGDTPQQALDRLVKESNRGSKSLDVEFF